MLPANSGPSSYYLSPSVVFKISRVGFYSKGWRSHFFIMDKKRRLRLPSGVDDTQRYNVMPILSVGKTKALEKIKKFLLHRISGGRSPFSPLGYSLYLSFYPDGEDEGGQVSSSLAISIRWIYAVKLPRSDLATLAQREGGE
ncbi:hypothetical protein GW17_00045838 [Ensete ventricosum]|nr:hypothetical protein GW17_00045838 [Ensete ventricosum]